MSSVEIVTKVNAYRKQNPGMSMSDACKAVGINPQSFYTAKYTLKKTTKKNKPTKRAKTKVIDLVPHVDQLVKPESSRMVLLFGTNKQLIEFVKELEK